MAIIELEKLDADKKDELIDASTRFLQTVTRCVGAKEGQQLFNNMTEYLGQELADTIWMKILTGDYMSTVYVMGSAAMSSYHANYSRQPVNWANPTAPSGALNKINFIKLIREHVFMGLKESKDFVDNICIGGQERFNFDSYEKASAFRKACKNFSNDLIID